MFLYPSVRSLHFRDWRPWLLVVPLFWRCQEEGMSDGVRWRRRAAMGVVRRLETAEAAWWRKEFRCFNWSQVCRRYFEEEGIVWCSAVAFLWSSGGFWLSSRRQRFWLMEGWSLVVVGEGDGDGGVETRKMQWRWCLESRVLLGVCCCLHEDEGFPKCKKTADPS